MARLNSYEAVCLENGSRKICHVDAVSAQAARKQLQLSGQVVLRVSGKKRKSKKTVSLTLFIQELVALLEAGLVVTEAVEVLRASSRDDQMRNLLEGLVRRLFEGCQLSQAMRDQPDIFPVLLVNTVTSSEQTGHLSSALKRYQYYEQRMEQLRKRLRAMLTYPIIVMSMGGLILCFLMGYIIPSFSQVFVGAKNLTGSAALILWWGNLVKYSASQLVLALVGFITGIVMIFRQPAVKQLLLQSVLKIPQFRHQQQLSILVRFYRTLGLLLEGGVPVTQALHLAQAVLPYTHRPQLERVKAQVQAGQAMSVSLESQQLTTPVASRLLQVGERSGELAGMCERIAAFYDEALERAIETFSKIFEPVLMILVGGIVGLVVFLLYMPIFEMAGGFS